MNDDTPIADNVPMTIPASEPPTFRPCDLDKVLSESTRGAMRSNPDMPLVRGLILAELGVYVPDEIRGLLAVEQWLQARVPIEEDWVTWIDDQGELHSLPPCVNGPQGWEKLVEPVKSIWDVAADPLDPPPAAPVTPEGRTVLDVPVEATDTEYGRMGYQMARIGRGRFKLTAQELKDMARNADDYDDFVDLLKGELGEFAENHLDMTGDDMNYGDTVGDPEHEDWEWTADTDSAAQGCLQWLQINAPELHQKLTEE